MLRVNDKVSVNGESYENQRKMYPFIPDLSGKIGVVFKIQTKTNVTQEELDLPIYWVRFEPFLIGVIPLDGHACDTPTQWREETDFSFVDENYLILEEYAE